MAFFNIVVLLLLLSSASAYDKNNTAALAPLAVQPGPPVTVHTVHAACSASFFIANNILSELIQFSITTTNGVLGQPVILSGQIANHLTSRPFRTASGWTITFIVYMKQYYEEVYGKHFSSNVQSLVSYVSVEYNSASNVIQLSNTPYIVEFLTNSGQRILESSYNQNAMLE
jgi:hypothetical protein